MSQELVNDFELVVYFNGYNSVTYGAVPERSYAWDINVEPIPRGFYGYGYGVAFYDIESVGAIDYFHVIGISGTTTGYGIESTKGGTIDEYNFGWGYEFAPVLISNNADSIEVVATVTENSVPMPNVRVVFVESVGAKLSVNAGFTDENGELKTVVTFDSSKETKKILDSNDSPATLFSLKSTIANTSMIGDENSGDNIWIVYLPKGKSPEQFYLPSEETEELGDIRITVTDPKQEYKMSKVKPLELIEFEDDNQWALKFESDFNYPFNDLGEDGIELVTVNSTTLEIFTVSNSNKKFEKLPKNGWLNIRAYIDEQPQENEKKIVVNVNSNQNVYDQSVFELFFNSYAFQNYRNYSYPV